MSAMSSSSICGNKNLLSMARYRSPLTVTAAPCSYSTKFGTRCHGAKIRSTLLEVKRLKKTGNIYNFLSLRLVISIPKTLSFSISALIQSGWEYLSFSIPMSGNIYLFISLSLSADWSSIYLFLSFSLSLLSIK